MRKSSYAALDMGCNQQDRAWDAPQARTTLPTRCLLASPVQIAPLGAKMSEIFNTAVIAAYDINRA